MYCSQCGKQIIDDAAFCPFCGAPVKAATQQMAQPQPRSDTTAQNRDKYHVPGSNPGSGEKVKIRTAVVIPLLGIFAYYLGALIFDFVFPVEDDTTWYLIIDSMLDVIFTIILTILFAADKRKNGNTEETHPLRMGFFGWLCLAVLFCMVYWTSESVANWILVMVDDSNIYVSLEGNDQFLYELMSISLAPVAEELIYRWMCYHSFRKRMGFWPAFILSTMLFTIAHGTLMHIPITIALSLMICILYEITGQFRWCIIIHLAFNLAAETIIFWSGIGAITMTVLWLLTVLFMICLWQFRDFFFNKVFMHGKF